MDRGKGGRGEQRGEGERVEGGKGDERWRGWGQRGEEGGGVKMKKGGGSGLAVCVGGRGGGRCVWGVKVKKGG